MEQHQYPGYTYEELRYIVSEITIGFWETILPGISLTRFFGPAWSGLRWFMFVLYLSYFSPFIIFTFLFVLRAIGSKVQHKLFHAIAILLAFAVLVAPFVFWQGPGSIAMLVIAVPFVMTVTVFILNFVKLLPLDYAILFSSFYYIFRFAGSTSLSRVALGITIPALYVLLTVLVVYKLRLGKLKGNLFYCWFTCVLTFMNGYGVQFIFYRYVVGAGQARATRFEALFLWSVALFIIITVSTAIIYVLKRLLGRHFDNINTMGKAYPQIERFFIYNSVGIIIFMAVIHVLSGAVSVVQHPFTGLFDLIVLFAMLLQLSFIIMFFRITWLGDNLRNKSIENQSLAVYSSNLGKNLDDIKHIKHDIKNIFLTMGNFVEESGNAQMQDFYRNKISPFVGDELMKSDLHGKLAGIDNEQIKAFLYYKISQAVERHITIELDVLVPPCSLSPPWETSLEFIDLVRILGVLLDNAIEECVQIPGGVISIKISRNADITSYTIKNTVRQEIKANGVRAGVSTKGTGRGKGLVSVQGIIEKYDFITLNSYFYDDCFVQNLVVYRVDLQK